MRAKTKEITEDWSCPTISPINAMCDGCPSDVYIECRLLLPFAQALRTCFFNELQFTNTKRDGLDEKTSSGIRNCNIEKN